MSRFLGTVFLLFIISMKVEAQGIRAVLGDDSVRFIYITEAWGQEIGSLDVEAGVLSTGTDNTLVHLGALVQNRNLDSTLRLAIGARGYYASINNTNATFLSFGGDLVYTPDNWRGIGLGASYFIAPSFTSFTGAESFSEYSVSIHYQITPQGQIAFGYHKQEVQLESELNVRTIEKGAFVGLRFDF